LTVLAQDAMRTELAERLEQWYRTRDLTSRLPHDPIAFPRRYRAAEDRAVAGLIAASLAYGYVKAFWPAVQRLLDLAGPSPAEFVRQFDPRRERTRFRPLYYRFSDSNDLIAFFLILKTLIDRGGSLRGFFESWSPTSARCCAAMWTPRWRSTRAWSIGIPESPTGCAISFRDPPRAGRANGSACFCAGWSGPMTASIWGYGRRSRRHN